MDGTQSANLTEIANDTRLVLQPQLFMRPDQAALVVCPLGPHLMPAPPF